MIKTRPKKHERRKRDKLILDLMAEGFTRKEIADKLNVTITTIDNRVKFLQQETNSPNKINLIVKYVTGQVSTESWLNCLN